MDQKSTKKHNNVRDYSRGVLNDDGGRIVGAGAYLCFGTPGLLRQNLLSGSLRGVAPISVSGVPTLNMVLISLRMRSVFIGVSMLSLVVLCEEVENQR